MPITKHRSHSAHCSLYHGRVLKSPEYVGFNEVNIAELWNIENAVVLELPVVQGELLSVDVVCQVAEFDKFLYHLGVKLHDVLARTETVLEARPIV